jgi:hypothetical protein
MLLRLVMMCDLHEYLAESGAICFTRTQVRERYTRFPRFQPDRLMITQYTSHVLAAILCCNRVETTILKHVVATLMHILVAESGTRCSKQTFSVKKLAATL